ncbi:BTAD domain-containing putative transcriptional regulator [Cryptosporangium sp. NPDC048952]|uniref:BTAD domain-containing putative transcriptional regulator n=1 Tax=Cryptosporangium sp. NPDC048952 TaxID=3363961 RepID=UPI00371298A9
MNIGLLGAVEVRDSAGLAVPVTGVRQRALLCRLALDPGRLVTVDRLVDDLWDARPPAAPGNALQSAVSRLRRDLDRAGPPGRNAIGSHPAGYRLSLSPALVDLHEFGRLVAAGTSALRSGDAQVAASLLREALGLWRGPALADAGDAPFVLAAASQAEELRLTALEGRVAADLSLGVDATALVTELTAACAAHPLREGLAARLIQALVAAGRRADALERFADTRRMLADRLGVDPGQELREAHLAALREEAPAEVLPRGGNLPASLTSFVGRSAELARVVQLLASGRLVTLTGPGGVGKTRLALEAVSAPAAPDGVWLVELAGVGASVDALASAVLSVLARPTVVLAPAEGEPVEQLAELLRTRRLVLVLDNAEHVVEPLALLVTRVLAAAPGVRALVTSREALGVVGEALCPVSPLPVASAIEEGAPGAAAVRLFAERAAAVRPGFAVTAENAAEVTRICAALDGLPLAIELAAARLRSLSLTEVASRLDDRFALLGRGSRGGVPRHRTLRAVMDGSWELLTAPERTLLRRLALFAGPAPLAAIDAVCGPGTDLPDVVGDLVDRSLVVPVDGPDGRRYRLLETVRAYAAERLAEAGEGAHVAAAHTAYLLDVVERDEPVLRTGDQLGAIARFQAWHADLDAATSRALAAGDVRVVRRLVAARLWFWWLTGQRRTAATWATQALTLGEVSPTPDTATALCLLAATAGPWPPTAPAPGASYSSGAHTAVRAGEGFGAPGGVWEAVAGLDHPASMFAVAWLGGGVGSPDTGGPAWMEAAAVRFAQHPDPWCRAASRVLAGHAAWDAGDADRAHAAFAAARALFTPLGERWGLLLAASSIAMVTGADDPAAALAALREAEALAVELDGLSEIPELLVQIATLAGRLGEFDGAADALTRADALAARTEDSLLRARIAHARGEVARYHGDLPTAVTHHHTALSLLATDEPPPQRAPVVGPPAAVRFTAQLHSCLARVEAERGSPTAGEWHARALLLSARTGDAPLRADVLERYAAWCASSQARAPHGARALGAAWALRHGVTPHRGDTALSRPMRGGLPEAGVARERLVAVLGEEAFGVEWRAGSTWDAPERTLGQ